MVENITAGRLSLNDIIDRGAEITRLGQGITESGDLREDACERVIKVLEKFNRHIHKNNGHWLAGVATSACRRAKNRQQFFDSVERVTGLRPVLIGGDKEAQLTYRGVKSSLSAARQGIIMDIGGGSTELIFFNAEGLKSAVSLDVGVVSLKEKCVSGEKWKKEFSEYLKAEIEKYLPPSRQAPGSLIVVGGTGTTVSACLNELKEYDPRVVHGDEVTIDSVENLIEDFKKLSFSEIEDNSAVSAGRGDVILPGLFILKEFMHHYGKKKFIVSDLGILAGLLQEAVS